MLTSNSPLYLLASVAIYTLNQSYMKQIQLTDKPAEEPHLQEEYYYTHPWGEERRTSDKPCTVEIQKMIYIFE